VKLFKQEGYEKSPIKIYEFSVGAVIALHIGIEQVLK